MRASDRYGPRKAAHTGLSVAQKIRRTWWWGDGVRFAQRGDVLYGWVLGWSGRPVACGRWLIPWAVEKGLSLWVEDLAMGLLRKGEKVIGNQKMHAEAADDPLVLGHPVLWAFLTDRTWEDGSPREPGSLLVFEQDGMVKAMLRDRNDGTCLWLAARSLSHLLAAAEGALCDPAADWRLDRKGPGDQAKRVPKR